MIPRARLIAPWWRRLVAIVTRVRPLCAVCQSHLPEGTPRRLRRYFHDAHVAAETLSDRMRLEMRRAHVFAGAAHELERLRETAHGVGVSSETAHAGMVEFGNASRLN